MSRYKEDNNNLKKNKNVKKYTLIPEGFEQEYEEYLEKESKELKSKNQQEIKDKFDRKCKAMQEILHGRQKFISEVGTYKVNHDEAQKRAENKLLAKTIIDYCKEKGISLYKTTEDKGKVVLKYIDNEGKNVIKEFDKEELLRNVKKEEQQK